MTQLDDLGQAAQAETLRPPPAPPTALGAGQEVPAEPSATVRGARRLEQAIVRVDPRSVLNLSLAFFRRMLLIGLGLGVLFWAGAFVTGTASSIDTFIQEITGYPSLTVLGFQGLLVTIVLGLTFVVGGALVVALVVVVFNLASDLGGGIKMTVMETELDEHLIGSAETTAATVNEPTGPRPVGADNRARGTGRRRPVLGADVTSLTAGSDTGAVGHPEHAVDGSSRLRTQQTPRVLRGALVVGVEPGSPAQSAGLSGGDVIVSVGGRSVDSPVTLGSALGEQDTDAPVDVSWVDRQGRYRTAIVHLAHRSG